MRVSILAYDGCLGFEIFGLADLLLVANRISGAARPNSPLPFVVEVIGARSGAVRLAGGASLSVQRAADRTDLLVVPAFDLAGAEGLDDVLDRLSIEIAFIARAGARQPVAGICGGSFLLAEAGLLDGRRATTAWAFAPELARRHPAVRVQHEAMLVRDGDILTSGAISACTDLALDLIRENAGPELARSVGRLGLIDGGRASQAPYVDTALLLQEGEPFSRRVIRRLGSRLSEPYSLNCLAQELHVSDRTLMRRFKRETGRTPLEQLQEMRIERARKLLETTALSIADIAASVSYRDVSTFSRLFTRRTSVTPAAYRRRFRPL
ncbi:GlxA family transcriptional regulator [Brevundimonas diminuta]|uniref:AraC family transcriptional regulator n=1 Tax=Brevundimonas diminuta TaxID=293 RepID=A0A1Z3LVK4_BREDI|nr:helix-turn-helix domain-containing protein [Brevundimonas diminuta]ASD26201.1 AraC family transcriptional regulator [Brevundimonas diminuta]